MVKFGLKMTIFATESKILPQFFNAEPSLVIYKGINCREVCSGDVTSKYVWVLSLWVLLGDNNGEIWGSK